MKLEIELDLNKIDYDSINKQIAEKVAELNIKETYDIESKINTKINTLVKDEVGYSYNSYLEKYWSSPTSEGKRLVENITKTEIENRVRKIIDEQFATVYTDDFLKELMVKMLPDVFTYVMIQKIECGLSTKDYNIRDSLISTVNSMIEDRLHR